MEAKALTVDSAQRNQRESPFLQLPPEIRNRIYEYALSRSHVQKHRYHSLWVGLSTTQDPFALLFVCRQIYAETAVLPYRLTRFGFTFFTGFNRWLEKLMPVQRDSMEVVQFSKYDIAESEEAEGWNPELHKLPHSSESTS